MKTKGILIFYLLLGSFIFSQEVVDETTLKINTGGATPPPASQAIATVGIKDYLVMVFVLILVIGALYFVLKIVKRIGGNRIGADNDIINVLSTKVLRGSTALHLVEVENQIFLIGATDTSINSIAEITDKESKDSITLRSSEDETNTQTFIQILSDRLKKNNISIGGEATPKVDSKRDRLNRF